MINDDFAMPAAIIWKAVAEILTKGIGELPQTAVWGAIIGGLIGILVEVASKVTKGRFPLSAIGMGLAFVIQFETCFAMFLGSFLFWVAAKTLRDKDSLLHRVFVQNLEPVCAGVIAGGALMGITTVIADVIVLPWLTG